MGFLLDSSVKPVSSLAPIDFFCKRSAKDTPLCWWKTSWPHPRGHQQLNVPSRWGGSQLQGSGGLSHQHPGHQEEPRDQGRKQDR